MVKKLLVLNGLLCCLSAFNPAQTQAQEAPESENWKQVLMSDKAEVKEQKREIKENAQAAKAQELELKKQIKDALDAGDAGTAEKLRNQLRAMHRENVQERVEDKRELQSQLWELKKDTHEAKKEWHKHVAGDRDNNPPGPKGGPGTNWENPPGPKGGAGSSPDRRGRGR